MTLIKTKHNVAGVEMSSDVPLAEFVWFVAPAGEHLITQGDQWKEQLHIWPRKTVVWEEEGS